MREMKRQLWRPGNMLYPVPAAMVSVAGEEAKSNIITIAWAGTYGFHLRAARAIFL